MQTIARAADLASIIAEWERLSREEPWHVDPHRYGIDTLHETIRAVLDITTWGGIDAFAAERLVRTAAAHGEQRRAQGTSDDALFREYHALRAALWRFLHQAQQQGSATMSAIVRVDVAIGIATTAAVRAFHRNELGLRTSWEEDLLQQASAVARYLADQLQAGQSS